MRSDLNDLKKLTLELIQNDDSADVKEKKQTLIDKIYNNKNEAVENNDARLLKQPSVVSLENKKENNVFDYAETIVEEESLSLLKKEKEMIEKALERCNGKRKVAAEELGISERTLYRKIKQYNLNEEE